MLKHGDDVAAEDLSILWLQLYIYSDVCAMDSYVQQLFCSVTIAFLSGWVKNNLSTSTVNLYLL